MSETMRPLSAPCSSIRLPELLAPAGGFATAEAAFDHGADAIYIGVSTFNLRAHAPHFSVQDLPGVLVSAHNRSKKVYVALNTMPNDETLLSMEPLFKEIQSQALMPDALIISDPGVFALSRKHLPTVKIHMSTQTGIFNSGSLQFWKDQGAVRAVLPREMTVQQIAMLARREIMETEIFIHGAMCVSISGRCLLGLYAGNRHPNLGDCPQPCRLPYRITPLFPDADGESPSFSLEENGDKAYLLNSKDLCALPLLPELIATGVDSFKIEGRNKSMHYVASVVRVYRTALDAFARDPRNYMVQKEWVNELNAVEHRTYTTGFYGTDHLLQEIFTSKAERHVQVVGIIKGMLPDDRPLIDVKNVFKSGEVLEVLPVQQKRSIYEITFTSLTDVPGNPLDRTPVNRLVVGRGVSGLRPGDMLRRKLPH